MLPESICLPPWEAHADPNAAPVFVVDLIYVSRVLAGADPFLPEYSEGDNCGRLRYHAPLSRGSEWGGRVCRRQSG